MKQCLSLGWALDGLMRFIFPQQDFKGCYENLTSVTDVKLGALLRSGTFANPETHISGVVEPLTSKNVYKNQNYRLFFFFYLEGEIRRLH